MTEVDRTVGTLKQMFLDREMILNRVLEDEEVREAISLLLGSEED